METINVGESIFSITFLESHSLIISYEKLYLFIY